MPAGKGIGFDSQFPCIPRSERREWCKRPNSSREKEVRVCSGPLLAVERKSDLGTATSGFDPGCVKTQKIETR
jgi:hypothetical protein